MVVPRDRVPAWWCRAIVCRRGGAARSCRRAVVPSCRRAVVPSCRRAVVPSCRRAVVPSCRRAVVPSCRRAVVPSCRRAVVPAWWCRAIVPSCLRGGAARPRCRADDLRQAASDAPGARSDAAGVAPSACGSRSNAPGFRGGRLSCNVGGLEVASDCVASPSNWLGLLAHVSAGAGRGAGHPETMNEGGIGHGPELVWSGTDAAHAEGREGRPLASAVVAHLVQRGCRSPGSARLSLGWARERFSLGWAREAFGGHGGLAHAWSRASSRLAGGARRGAREAGTPRFAFVASSCCGSGRESRDGDLLGQRLACRRTPDFRYAGLGRSAKAR
ncbi:uncharacterized protein CMC5_024440 [Chondromyces crocatus]|uniref:Uncharacterized protein n=1 Tax=Chondromyces crocatus TaxID=52 RepID=A0A0K1EBR9_CHOCO|nr:uncharacterized protein CMC5_024440 [Chondromyces crocatus]